MKKIRTRFSLGIATILALSCLILSIYAILKKTTLIPSLSFGEDQIHHETEKKFLADVYAWSDTQHLPRRISLIRNDSLDPTGSYGGYIRSYQYQVGKEVRTCTGSGEEPGWGYLVNHFNEAGGGNSWITTLDFPGRYRRLFRGRHHALHEYTWDLKIKGFPLAATVHWLVADGTDHPLFAVTYDASKAGANAINADTRSPYGELGWDGDQKSKVAGVGWGDRYKFRTKGENLGRNSGWTYQEKNRIPYALMWSQAVDAEMGIVKTQSYEQHDAGGYWLFSSWGKDSDGPLPENWNWTYQLNQYQLDQDPSSKRLAWGSNYGAVGQTSYPAYGNDRTLSGYPYQSYSVYMVLGQRSAVQQQVQQLELIQNVEWTGQGVRIAEEGVAGIARTDIQPYQPKGWNAVYGVWELIKLPGLFFHLDFKLKEGEGALHHPIFHIQNPEHLELRTLEKNGVGQLADRDYLLSVDPESHALWLTLVGELNDKTRITLHFKR